MRTSSRAFAPMLCALFALQAPIARGSFHLWQIKEVFSNGDGSVQFIELFTASGGQEFLSGHNFVATSDGMAMTFNFSTIPVVFPATTANHHFLMATAGFAAIAGGVAPDFTIPANFFKPNAVSISMNFAGGFDTLALAGSAIPIDGVMSLTDSNVSPGGIDNLTAGVNSPTNFAGAAGSINVGGTAPSAGDFDEDGAVDAADLAAWQTGYGMQGAAVDHADGDADDDNDVDGGDFLVWQQELGASPASAAVPEPATGILLSIAALATLRRKRRRRALSLGLCPGVAQCRASA